MTSVSFVGSASLLVCRANVERHLHGAIELDHFPDRALRVRGVRAFVDRRALDHQIEACRRVCAQTDGSRASRGPRASACRDRPRIRGQREFVAVPPRPDLVECDGHVRRCGRGPGFEPGASARPMQRLHLACLSQSAYSRQRRTRRRAGASSVRIPPLAFGAKCPGAAAEQHAAPRSRARSSRNRAAMPAPAKRSEV